eukprot:s116_g4.t1
MGWKAVGGFCWKTGSVEQLQLQDLKGPKLLRAKARRERPNLKRRPRRERARARRMEKAAKAERERAKERARAKESVRKAHQFRSQALARSRHESKWPLIPSVSHRCDAPIFDLSAMNSPTCSERARWQLADRRHELLQLCQQQHETLTSALRRNFRQVSQGSCASVKSTMSCQVAYDLRTKKPELAMEVVDEVPPLLDLEVLSNRSSPKAKNGGNSPGEASKSRFMLEVPFRG